jgi:hypothetical protein
VHICQVQKIKYNEAMASHQKLVESQFTGSLGIRYGTAPATVKLRPVVNEVYRTLPNKAEWMRSAIEDRMIAEGWLSKTTKLTPDGKEVVEYEALIAV